jgi:hypothetical protein
MYALKLKCNNRIDPVRTDVPDESAAPALYVNGGAPQVSKILRMSCVLMIITP